MELKQTQIYLTIILAWHLDLIFECLQNSAVCSIKHNIRLGGTKKNCAIADTFSQVL